MVIINYWFPDQRIAARTDSDPASGHLLFFPAVDAETINQFTIAFLVEWDREMGRETNDCPGIELGEPEAASRIIKQIRLTND